MGENVISTPDTGHLSSVEFESVYDPAEDSFLLLDTLEKELDRIRALDPVIAVEIGCGSGVISTALSCKLASTYFLATDINTAAGRATVETARRNNAKIEVVQTDVLTSLAERLEGKVDLLVCNPPYVATEDSEVGERGLSAAWAGGSEGLTVTSRVVSSLELVLSPTGLAYIVLEQCNRPAEFIARLNSSHRHLQCETVLSRRAGRELLYVVKIQRKVANSDPS